MEPTTICTAACDGCRYWDQCALLRDGVVRQCHRESQKSQRNRVGGKKSEIKKVEESGEGGDGEKGKGRKTTPKPMMAASNANNYNVDDRQGRVAEEILLSAKLETQLLGDCNILNTDSAPHRRRSGDLGCHHSARAGEKFVHTSTTVTNFMKALYMTSNHVKSKISPATCSGFSLQTVWHEMLDTFPRSLIPRDKKSADDLVSHLVSYGTKLILHDKQHLASGNYMTVGVDVVASNSRIMSAISHGLVAWTVLLVEQVSGGISVLDYHSKMRDLLVDITGREITKFFHTRNACNCLEKEYKRLRRNTACVCYQCFKVVECKQILQCSRCKVAQYCGAQCQRLHWSSQHKEWCNKHWSTHKEWHKKQGAVGS